MEPGSAQPATATPVEPAQREPEKPAVVGVIVAHEPGEWFADTLRSFAEQTYENLSVLVIDTAADPALPARVADVLPAAHLRQVPRGTPFGAAANEVLSAVQGASFLVLAHDDVRLSPDAVQVMVEEAFRANAGIVGPKLVEWHRPDRLLSVGMGADKTGYPSALAERGELDQSQHDSVRDVFYVPGAVTLVRADLFATLGGYDPGIDYHADDLDLCWRARVVGARVVVAPAARVGHLEALGVRRPVDDRRRLQMRHRLRAMRVSYRWSTRFRVVPQAALLALAEIVYCVILGRFRQARDVWGAWWWNFRHSSEARRRRRALNVVRAVPDREVRRQQVRGSVRFAAFLRGQIGSREDRLPDVAGTSAGDARRLRTSKARSAFVAWFVLMLALVVGSRELIFGRLSAVGELLSFGSSATGLLDAWASGYRAVGLGAVAAAPTILGLAGGLGVVLLGALELLRKVAVLGLLPVGLAGMWRLCRPIGSRRSSIVALVVYAAIPVPYNAIAGGSWSALAVYAAAPWVLGQLARASSIAPFGPLGGIAGPAVRDRPLVQRALVVGVVSGLVALVLPAGLMIGPILAVALVLGGLLAGQVRGTWALLVTGVGGAVVAVVLQLPWTVSLASGPWSAWVGAPASGTDIDVPAILRFHTGPLGAGPLGYMFLVAAALALLIGREWRLGWAVRGWVLALGGMAAVWVQAQGWIPEARIAPELLLVPAAAGLALATAMGMAAFEVDLRDYHFGLRQVASVLAAAALVVATVPVLGAVAEGSWGQPRGDFDGTLNFMNHEGESDDFRVLWVGEASSLPIQGWWVDPPTSQEQAALAYATSDDGTPTLVDFLPGAPSAETEQLGELLRTTVEGGTSRLGAALAPAGVRYIVVPLAPAPEPYVRPTQRPDDLLAALDGQLDLSPVTAAGTVVYRNDTWQPVPIGPGDFETSPGRPLALAAQAVAWLVVIVILLRVRVVRDERRRLP